ncbi:MAG: chromosomal replication initiator protein DnaA [Solirubrobacterales bacterium]|nr:chromosomal replication initiator protein DnaA [Solirubrobacterales bacterium]
MLFEHSDAPSAWTALRTELRRVLGDSAFDIWLGELTAGAWDGRVLSLVAPGSTASWIAGRYGPAIDRAARAALGRDARVLVNGRCVSRGPASDPSRDPIAETPPDSPFNPRYRFEQFIIGNGNRLAHAAALAVAEAPGDAYNPLFLHGPPGMGKTHLLHAIGNYVLAFGAGATVRYTTAETFTNDFLGALNSRSLDSFKSSYRDADVLLIDDVQFLASKARTEEEFFHTFNALHERNRQVVLTCDRLPRALVGLEQRLRERFEAGLVTDLQPPDRATRIAILRKRAHLDGVHLADPAVLHAIADRVTDNIRALEGALIRVVAFHSLTGRPIDRELTDEVLDAMYPRRGTRAPTIDDVQALVAEHFGLTVEQLTSASRAAKVAWPRQVAIHLARQTTAESLPTIGRAFGNRNHATVLHACNRVADRLRSDQHVVDLLGALSTRLADRLADRDS